MIPPRAVVLDHSFIPESREISLELLDRGYAVTLHTSLQCRSDVVAFCSRARLHSGVASSMFGWIRKRQIPARWEKIPTRNWVFPDVVHQTAGRYESLRRPGNLLIHLGFDVLASATSIPDASLVLARQYSGVRAFRLAQRAGVRSVLLTTTPDPREEDRIVSAEEARIGLPHRRMDRFDNLVWRRGAVEWELADGILSSSDFAAASLVRAGVPPRKIKVLQRTYAIGHDTRANPARTGGPLKLLFAGQLTPRKGVHHLVAAANALATEGCNLQLDLVGGEPEAEYASLLRRIAGPHVRFVGAVAKDQLGKHYAACDALVLPTLSDSFGMVVVEAQAVGAPVVTTDRCGASVTDGVDGLVVRAGDTEALTSALRRLAAQPELRRALGEAGQRRLRTWHWEAYRREAVDWMSSLPTPAPRPRGSRATH